MTNDIEAAARAVIEAWDRPLLGAYAETMHEAVSHLRSALAHAARGEPVRGWRDREGTLPARRDGDKVARVDEMVPWFLAPTPPPATGEAERCEDHGREGCIDCEPATGEAGTRGEGEVGAHAMDVAERCYYAIKGGAPYRDSIRAMAAIIEAERPLPEAREGGGK